MAKKKRKTNRDTADDDSISFEAALAEVEEIVGKLESGEADLTESLEFYERGVQRLKRCHQLLHQAERKVTLLSGFDADGNPVTEDFGHDKSESLEKKRGERSSRRSAGSGSGDRNSRSKGEDGDPDDSVDEFPGLF